MSFLLDSNIFIEAKNTFYAFDICPGFWTWLSQCDETKSVTMVKQELLAGADELTEWVKEHLPEDFFITENEEIQEAYRTVANHVHSLPEFQAPAKLRFLSGADGWLIAAAILRRDVIVTHEQNDHKCRRKILLPVIAAHFGLHCQKIYDVLRTLQVQFH
ncbi:MAG: DUF4411 family protein [Atribacterota bacterium]|jgi:hypothetical protein|nr:DUF4411 family protein [Atribacterota bacterium]